MILLVLASKQIWPHVLTVAHLKPQRVFLLHSDDPGESRGPAQRLKRLFDDVGLAPTGATFLEQIPHDDFGAISERLDRLAANRRLNLAECYLSFTGGNKLMAAAAFRWAARRSVVACYLERGNVLTWFQPGEGEPRTRVERIDGHITDSIDPLALLCCQFGDGALASEGELLTLNNSGQKAHQEELKSHLSRSLRLDRGGFDFRRWLHISNPLLTRRGEPEPEGQNLEYAVAFAVLRHKVAQVRHSVELKPNEETRLKDGELDVVFNWNGRLWVADCKDKASGETKLETLRTALLAEGANPSRLDKHLEPIRRDLAEKDINILREDLLQVSEVGGLLGSALAVRAETLPPQAAEFAKRRSPRVEIILARELPGRLEPILHPSKPASRAELAIFSKASTRARL